MDRVQIPIPGDECHVEQDWQMSSLTERDEQMKTYPWPLPDGYVFGYSWDLTKGCGLLRHKVMLAPPCAVGVAGTPTPEAPKGNPNRARMETMSMEDLETEAPQHGVTWDHRWSRATAISVILRAIKEGK